MIGFNCSWWVGEGVEWLLILVNSLFQEHVAASNQPLPLTLTTNLIIIDSMSSCRDSHHAATNITKKYPNTLPETDIAPENRPGPKKKTTLPTVHFQGRLLLVSGRVPAFVWESGLPLVKKDHICGLVVTQILNQLAIPTFIKQWQALFPQPSFRSSTGVGKLLTAAYLVDGENGRRFWMLKTLCSVLTVLWFFGRPSAAAISSTVSLIKLYVIMIHTWCIYVINIYITN